MNKNFKTVLVVAVLAALSAIASLGSALPACEPVPAEEVTN